MNWMQVNEGMVNLWPRVRHAVYPFIALEFRLKYQSIRYSNIDLEKVPKLTKKSTFGSISEESKYGLINWK